MVYSAQRRSYGSRNCNLSRPFDSRENGRLRSASCGEVLVVLSSTAPELCSCSANVRIERVPGVAGRVERWPELRDDVVLELPRALSRMPGQQQALALPRRQPIVLSCVERYVLSA